MNNDRRKRLRILSDALEQLRDDLDYIRDGEQEAFDNLPDSLQESERGQRMEENLTSLENAFEGIDSAIDYIALCVE